MLLIVRKITLNEQDKFYAISNIDKIKEIKRKIRSYCNCGNHSIHSTDYEEEALKVKFKYF